MSHLRSKRKLQPKDSERFASAEPALFRELAVVICATGILPEKELHECWQMAEIVHRAFPEVRHVADLAAGHGLLAWMLVLLGRKAERPVARTAVAIDITRPKSAEVFSEAITKHWPDLMGTVYYVEGSIDSVTTTDAPGTLFVAVHACGSLSDRVLLAAMASGSSVAIMPCCHSLRKQTQTLSALGNLSGLSPDAVESNPISIDAFRSDALSAIGYRVSEETIEPEITKFHRLILAKASEQPRTFVPPQTCSLSAPTKRLGEIQAFEKIELLNVSDWDEVRQLSMLPSREWRRSFDMSFWIADDAESERLRVELEALTEDLGLLTSVSILDRFTHPVTQQLSIAFRIDMFSSSLAISKDDALALRTRIIRAVEGTYRLRN